jgi:hypothetical protein
MYQNNNDPESDDFDLGSFCLGDSFRAPEAGSRQPRYHSFLKGPISWAWIKTAAKAGRSALFIGLNLHRYRDLRRKEEVQISLQKLGDGVFSRQAVRHILRQLEAAGLIAMRRSPGRLLAFTILNLPEDCPETRAVKR